MRASSAARGAALGLVAALPAALLLRGFTVDDALVTARMASHLAQGLGYRFNPRGPVVDAVTPLGFAHLLAIFGRADALAMLERARTLGLTAWLCAAALLGALAPATVRGRATMAGALLLSAPLGAWAGAGMETGLVTALATLALAGGELPLLAAGVAAALRPELLGWSAVLAAGTALTGSRSARHRSRALLVDAGLALGPAVAVALARHAWFGSYAPLAVVAKPSDLSHGVFYAVGAFVGTGLPVLLVAPRALARADGRTRVLAASVATHWVVLALVGGDWMALYRLAVPVLPTAALAAARLADVGAGWWRSGRAILGAAGPLWVLVQVAWPGRQVLGHRLELIERGRGALHGASSVACLDAGWVGAATDADLLDLAGITDPLVARLPGGHTSKRIGEGLLENRAVDAAVLLLAPGAAPAPRWQDSTFARAVEDRVAHLPALETFRVRAELALGGTTQRYVVVVR